MLHIAHRHAKERRFAQPRHLTSGPQPRLIARVQRQPLRHVLCQLHRYAKVVTQNAHQPFGIVTVAAEMADQHQPRMQAERAAAAAPVNRCRQTGKVIDKAAVIGAIQRNGCASAERDKTAAWRDGERCRQNRRCDPDGAPCARAHIPSGGLAADRWGRTGQSCISPRRGARLRAAALASVAGANASDGF